jgi:hypothetical protein
MPIKRKLKVIKVPLENKPDIIMPNFPVMPILYLELLENKNKVKAELRTKEYKPNSEQLAQLQQQEPIKQEKHDDKKSKQRSLRIVDLENSAGIVEVLGGKNTIKESFSNEKLSDREEKRKIELDKDDTVLGVFSKEEPKEEPREERESRSDRKAKSSDGLSKLLRGDITSTESKPLSSISNSPPSNATYNNNNNTTTSNTTTAQPTIPSLPPSLSEINSSKPMTENGVRNLAYVTKVEEEELSKKREILYKFQKLKKRHPMAKIPEYSEFTDIKTLEREFNYINKDIEVTTNVDNYKDYLLYAFKGIEMFLVYYMDFPEINGFSKDQATKLNKYDEVLHEISEKNYISENKKWPPELRLIGIILFQTFSFVGAKWMIRKFEKGLGGNSNKQQQQYYTPNNPTVQPTFQSSGRKMQGPDVNFDDLDKKMM